MALFLDTGVLGLLTNPTANADAQQCTRWLRDCIAAGATVCVPEIADYELRRKLLHRDSLHALQKLDLLVTEVASRYVPLTTEAMQCAADYWGRMRKQGTPTAAPDSLDGDMILAAQANISASANNPSIIVTDNVGDLERVGDARRWRDLPPAAY
jgi:predicted nucleic acid-binding protein